MTRCCLRDCKVTFIIGRGFARLQILKIWKWTYLLNWVEYCDEILQYTYWYWPDLAQRIVKCHSSLVGPLPRFKFWKSETGPISRTFWNILIQFWIHTLILTRSRHRIYRPSLCRGPVSEKVNWNGHYTFSDARNHIFMCNIISDILYFCM